MDAWLEQFQTRLTQDGSPLRLATAVRYTLVDGHIIYQR